MAAHEDVYIDRLVRIAFIIGIVVWSFQLLYPLLGILAWGFILAVILYPAYVWWNKKIGNHSIIAAGSITLCVLTVLIGILFVVTNDVAHSVKDFDTKIRSDAIIISAPPPMVREIPFIGEQLHESWTEFSVNFKDEIKKNSETILSTGRYVLNKVLATGKDMLLFIIALLFSGVLLVNAESFMDFIRKFAYRVSQKNGVNTINLIRETIQNVSRGVIGIALVQTILFWLILVLSNVHDAGLLSLLAMILSIAQVGLFIIVIPLIIWLFFAKSLVVALIVSIALILVTLLDSFLKPFVLARGLSTPMMVIFIGVIGGILVYGLIGVFVGPIVLAIAYDLLRSWVENKA